MSVDQKKGRKREPVTRDRVMNAAVALADEGGIDKVSMRVLARSLGIEAMSLYNHVSGKDELLDCMVDHVVGEIELPVAGGHWKDEMRRRAISARAALLRHPWAPPLIVSRVNPGWAMLRYVDATIGCLRAAGFSYTMADHAWNAIDSHIYGFTLLERNFPLEPDEYAAAAAQYLPSLPQEQYPHLHALAASVADGSHSGVNEFEFGLTLILDGLERILAAS